MTDEQINEAIAKACGWKEVEPWLNGRRCFERKNDPCGYGLEDIPNYCTDLNAMHEAEKTIYKHHAMWNAYYYAVGAGVFSLHATARKKAEAFLKAIGKWEND